jgi:dienelactone hydrolase
VNRLATLVSLPALVATLLCALWLARLEAGGPRHASLELDGGVPATLYLPDPDDVPEPAPLAFEQDFEIGDAEGDAEEDAESGEARSPLSRVLSALNPEPRDSESSALSPPEPAPPPPLRPAAVVLAHGIASDRAGVSVLARSLARAGYAVLTPDLRGHGQNRNPFPGALGRRDFLVDDLRAAVDFLRASHEVDGARISVMGHSMGAGAALAYASRDPALDASVMISGGRSIDGPYRPANALFIYAEADPQRIRERAAELAGELAAESGWQNAMPGVVYGSVRDGRAVSQVEVARADHLTILSSHYAARRIIGWLDEVYRVERGTFFLPADPRLLVALLGMAVFIAVLPGLGAVVGRLAPRLAQQPGDGAPARLGAVVLALVATLPLVSVGGAGSLLPLAIADVVAAHLFAAGVALLGWLALSGRLQPATLVSGWAASLLAAGFGAVVVYFLLTPFGAVVHHLGLTPERAAAALLLAVLLAPFLLAFQLLLRRGRTFPAAIYCLLGRAAVVAILAVAARIGVLSGVVLLMLPVLAILFVVFELLSSAIYAASRNPVVAALVEVAWLAWVFAAVLPITW